MQCPYFEGERDEMCKEIFKTCPNVELAFNDSPANVFAWLLGRQIENIDYNEMCDMWRISGSQIYNIYKTVVRSRAGVGKYP